MTDFRDYLSGDAAVQDKLKKIENKGFILTYRAGKLVIRTASGTILSVCYNKMRIYAFVKQNNLDEGNAPDADEPSSRQADASPELRIAELEKTISRFRERGRLAVAQRDQWKKTRACGRAATRQPRRGQFKSQIPAAQERAGTGVSPGSFVGIEPREYHPHGDLQVDLGESRGDRQIIVRWAA